MTANPKLEFTPVKSSQLKGIAHDNETLHVLFKSKKIYSYHPVTKEQYDKFYASDSLGSYFHKNFKMNPELRIKQVTIE